MVLEPGYGFKNILYFHKHAPLSATISPSREKELFIHNRLVRVHCMIEIIWWTGFAQWELFGWRVRFQVSFRFGVRFRVVRFGDEHCHSTRASWQGLGWQIRFRFSSPCRWASTSSSLIPSLLLSYVNLEWCDKTNLSNLLLLRKSGTIKRLQLLSRAPNSGKGFGWRVRFRLADEA